MREKILYHQIHPAKLGTDILTTPPSLYLLWENQLIPGLLVAFIPSMVASFIIIRFANLDRYAKSGFGVYLANYMTNIMQALRILGLALTILGAWYHADWFLIPLGLFVVLLAWLRGKIAP